MRKLFLCAALALVPLLAAIANLVLLLSVEAPPCPESAPAQIIPERDADVLVLPDITDLTGSDAAGPFGLTLIGNSTPYLTVNINSSGAVELADEQLRWASLWRGVNLPVDPGPQESETPARTLDEIVIHVSHEDREMLKVPFFRIRLWQTNNLDEVASKLSQLAKVVGKGMPLVIDPRPSSATGPTCGLLAAASNCGFPIEFRPPPPLLSLEGTPDPRSIPWQAPVGRGFDGFARRLSTAAAMHPEAPADSPGPRGLSRLGVVIRADSRAPWNSVGEILRTCVRNKVWRVAFAAVREGREVVIGLPTYTVRYETTADILDDIEVNRDLPVPPRSEVAYCITR